jgi:hypothetical protein
MKNLMVVSALLVGVAAACGGGSAGPGTGGGGGGTAGTSGGGGTGTGGVYVGTGRYLPLKIDATWTYKITDASTGTVMNRVSKVETLDAVGATKPGVMAYRLRETDASGAYQLSWQEDQTTKIVRHREQSFDSTGVLKKEETYAAYRLRLDETPEHLAMGARWMETYMETQTLMGVTPTVTPKNETWVLEATAELVTVPAGTFTTIRVHRVGTMTAAGIVDKTYWFAQGVGKIKELGGGSTEELVSFSIP